MLGMLHHPHHAKVTPRFCKQYAQVPSTGTNFCFSNILRVGGGGESPQIINFTTFGSQIGPSIAKALQSYKEDVMEGRFPSTEYSPYKVVFK